MLKYNNYLTTLVLVSRPNRPYSPFAQSLCSLARSGPLYSKILDPPLTYIYVVNCMDV